MTTLKKSKMLSNWPKWLVVTRSVLFGNEDLEIHSYVSSFSVWKETRNSVETSMLQITATMKFSEALEYYAVSKSSKLLFIFTICNIT